MACIDKAPATPEYKILELRQYLSGEALKTIESLGHSGYAYEAAKERLERKFGGKRRHIASNLEGLETFKPIRPDNSKDIENFADLVDIAVINLKEAGRIEDLGDGSLYLKTSEKDDRTHACTVSSLGVGELQKRISGNFTGVGAARIAIPDNCARNYQRPDKARRTP